MKQFESQASFLMHNHIVHNNGDQRQCPLCNKQLASYSSALYHLKIHTKEKDYTCKYCNKSFTDSTGLMRHERTHTGEKPYKCTQCNKQFSQSGNLHRHLRAHQKHQLLVLKFNQSQMQTTPQSNTVQYQYNTNFLDFNQNNQIQYKFL